MKTSDFVGRKQELRKMAGVINSEKPGIVVIYGRRRVGKSSLIFKALQGKKALFFEGLENQSKADQIQNFCIQLKRQTNIKVERPPNNWTEVFLLLEDELKKGRCCLVLDEFQWMANYRTEIISSLKMVWDQYFSKIPGVSLILSGSIASFMMTKVVRSNALYGRTDLVINLKPFLLKETKEMLPKYGDQELLEAQMVFGGIPKYLELLKSQSSLYLAIDQLCFEENGYFLFEYDRIFVSHFGRNEDYRKIVKVLAQFPYGLYRQDLATKASLNMGGGFSNLLMDLESAGFISSHRPLDKASNSKLIRYILSDEFLRFYFAFMNNDKKKRKFDNEKFNDIIHTPRFYNWKGRAFELLCMMHSQKIAEVLGFSGIKFNTGPYFKKSTKSQPGIQIDLCFDRADHVLTLCEMKTGAKTHGLKALDEISKRAELMRSIFPKKTIQNVLIYTGNISSELGHSPEIHQTINATELI